MTRVDYQEGRLIINEKEYISVRDAVQETGLSASYITRRAKNGSIPSYRLGNIWLVDRAAVRALRPTANISELHATTTGATSTAQ